MKKTYMKPTFEVVKINAQRLLAGSEIDGGGNHGDYSPGTQESRSFSFGDEE